MYSVCMPALEILDDPNANICTEGHQWKHWCGMFYDAYSCKDCDVSVYSPDSGETWQDAGGNVIPAERFRALMDDEKPVELVEIRYEEDGKTIDEILSDKAFVHWEMLAEDCGYLGISHNNGQDLRQFYISCKDGKLVIADAAGSPSEQ